MSGVTLADFVIGSRWIFVPRDTAHPMHGHVVEVVRPPRPDVQHPSIRVQPIEGDAFAARPAQLQRITRRDVVPTLDTTPQLADARTRPMWPRLLVLCHDLHEADRSLAALHADDDQAVRRSAEARAAEARAAVTHRAATLAGMVVPRGTRPAVRDQVAQDIVRAAAHDAAQQRAARAGRDGRTLPPAAAVVEPSLVTDPARLERHQRHMINRIALSIHRRYFLSDRELRDLDAADREEEGITRVIGALIEGEQRKVGTSVTPADTRKGSQLHGTLDDNLMAAHRLSMELSNLVLADKWAEARAAAAQIRAHRLAAAQAQLELSRSRAKVDTGRFVHGDVLSVRDEHVVLDDDGEFVRYDGMTQYYVRLIVLHHGQGYGVVVANARELEVLTGHVVPPGAWQDLARWIEDLSERLDGKRPGRRQDDDEHLIYQEREGYLELRPSLKKYPDLLRALSCIRAALEVTPDVQGILPSEIGEAPEPGRHQPAEPSANLNS